MRKGRGGSRPQAGRKPKLDCEMIYQSFLEKYAEAWADEIETQKKKKYGDDWKSAEEAIKAARDDVGKRRALSRLHETLTTNGLESAEEMADGNGEQEDVVFSWDAKHERDAEHGALISVKHSTIRMRAIGRVHTELLERGEAIERYQVLRALKRAEARRTLDGVAKLIEKSDISAIKI